MAGSPFAASEDVRIRMGLATFSTSQTAQANALLAAAADLILDDLHLDADWLDPLDAVPSALKTTSIEMVTRVMQNPGGVRSRQETLGDHSHGESFSDTSATLDLTDRESLRLHRAVFGSSTASARLGGILDEVGPLLGRTGADFYIDDNGEVQQIWTAEPVVTNP